VCRPLTAEEEEKEGSRVVRLGVIVVLRLFIIITYRCRFINIFKQNDDDDDDVKVDWLPTG